MNKAFDWENARNIFSLTVWPSLCCTLLQGLTIRTSCPVTRIEYGSRPGQAPVTLHIEGQHPITCNAVLITVPLRILQVGALYCLLIIE